MRKGLPLFLFVLAAVAIPTAADNPAWFGTPGPAPLPVLPGGLTRNVAISKPVACGGGNMFVAGDETEVVEARASRSRADAGIVVFEHRAHNQRDELVCRARRTGLMHRRPIDSMGTQS